MRAIIRDMRKWKPRKIEPVVFDAFQSAVEPGHYRLYPSSEVPPGISCGGPDCEAVIVAASTFDGSKVTGLGPACTPEGTVYLWMGLRTMPLGSPPRKSDYSIYFKGRDGVPRSLHSKSSTDHHNQILTSTGLDGLVSDWRLPAAPEGTLKDYRDSKKLSFYEPFGWSS
ncbi:MAG: hypothetical protein C4570_07800 [Ammonifex sp.]|jgi:hypothetical protein|nr:MAG: hypothetical protein C4570_07800 [Ammonifex sp.]